MKLCPKCHKQFSDDANFCPVDAARLAPLESEAVATDSLSARFELGDRLGGGRTGAVHGATDKATGQPAAVKIIAPAVVALPGLAQRLERELKQLERVQSAGVAKVLASGKRGDDSWVALELLDGAQTLAAAIASHGPIPLDQAAHLIEVVGEALIEAAQVGVVHRDLAPKNVLFAGADVKLINFSLPVPTSDKVSGVAEFVAPEQHDGKPVDQRSNLYSLGALYYFVLTGRPVQLDHAGAVQPPSSLADVPAAVDAVILRALDRSPTKRFLTVRQFIDEVGRVARGGADVKSTQPLGRAGKPKAELVQTLLGVRGGGGVAPAATSASAPVGSSTVVGIMAPSPGSGGAASSVGYAASSGPGAMPAPLAPQAMSPERSPWAPPASAAPQGSGAMPPVDGRSPDAPGGGPPVVAPAPVVPAPLLAAPILGGGTTKRRGDDTKGKFRETMWFKKGELDAQAAQAAAEEHAKTGKLATADRADLLPIDVRYDDDGSLSRSDKEKYSLKTGATAMTAAVRDPGMSGRVSEDALIGEMKGGRNLVFAVIAIGLAAVALIVFLIAR